MDVYDAFSGRLIDSGTMQIVDGLMDAKKKKPFWEVVELVVDLWAKKSPQTYRSYLVDVQTVRSTRKNKHASSGGGYNELRYLADMPEFVMLVLRKLYDTDELDMDKEFFRKFCEKFPAFRVAER